MKKMILALSLILGASSAFAAGKKIVCTDVHAGPDHGIYITLDKNLKSALVETQSIAGPQVMAKLKCERSIGLSQNGADQINQIASCRDPRLADAGYVVIVSAGGFAGLTTAELFQTSLVGAESVANTICR